VLNRDETSMSSKAKFLKLCESSFRCEKKRFCNVKDNL
jgi:hypothetical protein